MRFIYHPVDHLAFSAFDDIASQLRRLLGGGGPKGPPSAPPTIPPIIISPYTYQSPAPAIDPRAPPLGPPIRPPQQPRWRMAASCLR